MIGRALVLVIAVAGLAGCPGPGSAEPEIYLGALTAAPPSLTGEVRNPFDEPPSIEISLGVGLGLGCTELCPGRSPSVPDCSGAIFAIEPAELGEIHPVDLPGREGTVLLIADAPGRGALTVETPCAEKTYELEVVE